MQAVQGGDRHRSLSRLCSSCSSPSPISGECPTLFREPLQFIVIAVMSVIGGTFSYTNGVFYATINSWRVQAPSRHRHGERHRENGLGKRLIRRRDDDDAHDDELQRFSWGPH